MKSKWQTRIIGLLAGGVAALLLWGSVKLIYESTRPDPIQVEADRQI